MNEKMTHLEADTTPIYLGYETLSRKYYFYFIKEGTPRFLIYCTYFYWGVGPQTALTLSPIPKEVEEELSQFLSGTLHYEFRKLRRNSRTTTAVKVFRMPADLGEEIINPISEVANDAGTTGKRRRARNAGPCAAGVPTRTAGTGAVSPIPSNGNVSGDIKPKRVRRTKQQMIEYRNSLESKKL